MKFTPRERDVYYELKDMIVRGEELCIACMVTRFWAVEYGRRDYDYYEHKQRKIVALITNELRKANPRHIDGLLSKFRINKVIWYLAIDHCEEHPRMRKYKILNTPVDHEIASNLATNRLEGMIYNQELRVETAVKRWPKLFKPRLRYIQARVPYLPNAQKEE